MAAISAKIKGRLGDLAVRMLPGLLARSARARATATAVLSEAPLQIGGRSYVLPLLAPSRLDLGGDREPWMDGAFAWALDRLPGMVVDIGANRGQTLSKILRLAPDRPYLGFEPQTACADALDRFIARNGLGHMRLVPVGLSDRTGVMQIWSRAGEDADPAASIVEGYRPADFYARSRLVPILQADSALAGIDTGPIAVIKIDVEGAEPEVLAGLRETLVAHRPTVLFEVLHNIVVATGQELDAAMLAGRNARAQAISETLAEIGFAIFHIRDGGLHRVGTIRPEVSRDMSTTNYLAVPAEAAPADGMALPAVPA